METPTHFPGWLIVGGWIAFALLVLGALAMFGWHIADKIRDQVGTTGPLKAAIVGVVLFPPLTGLLGTVLVYGDIKAITGAWIFWIGDIAVVLGSVAILLDDRRRARRDAQREAEEAVATTAEQIIRDEMAKIGDVDGAK